MEDIIKKILIAAEELISKSRPKRTVKKYRPQRGKSRQKSRQYYRKSKQKIKRKQKVYRKKTDTNISRYR